MDRVLVTYGTEFFELDALGFGGPFACFVVAPFAFTADERNLNTTTTIHFVT